MTREKAVRIVERELRAIATYIKNPDFINQKDRLTRNSNALRFLLKENKKVSWHLDQAIKRAVGHCKEIEKLRESDAHREMENFSLKKKLDRVTVEGVATDIKPKLCNMGFDLTSAGVEHIAQAVVTYIHGGGK